MNNYSDSDIRLNLLYIIPEVVLVSGFIAKIPEVRLKHKREQERDVIINTVHSTFKRTISERKFCIQNQC